MTQIKLEDITLNHLKILRVVDECHSFSIAAKKLGYSQALISKKVKQVEDYFGVRLLSRSPGSVSLTNKGKQLIAQAYSVVETVENLQQEFQLTLSFEGQTIAIGATPLLFETWLKDHLHRFQLCFPGSIPQIEVVAPDQSFSNFDLSHLDLLVNSISAYKEEHHCTRLTTHQLLAVNFDRPSNLFSETVQSSLIYLSQLDFSQSVLLAEIHQELGKNRSLSRNNLDRALTLNNYQAVIETAIEQHRFTVVPDFCFEALKSKYNIQAASILDAVEYGVYIHVPQFSEPLVVAERLVRSFRLDQESSERTQSIGSISSRDRKKQEVLVGIQRDSIGQIIASYGAKLVSDRLRSENAVTFDLQELGFQKIEIDRSFDLQIHVFDSSAEINRKMQRGELDICILDDAALLRNGADCFHDLSFSSRLVSIASYNLLGCDISVVLPKRSSIQSVYDLRGKRISTLFGSNAYRLTVMLLDLYGIDEADCTLIDEDPRTASTSLAHGTIDAYICCSSFAEMIENSVPAKRLQREQSFDIRTPSLRGIVARSQFIKESPKFLVSYLHDVTIANYWFLSNSVQAAHTLAQLTPINASQVIQFFDPEFGTRIDPTLKPQWSWLLKTLNRRLEGRYGISKFDVDFWMDDYLLRLVYSLLGLDYHLHQVSFSNELSNSYFLEEKFNRYIESFQPRLACFS